MDTTYSLSTFGLPDITEQTPGQFTDVEVKINATQMLQDFSNSFYLELSRANDRLVDRVQITAGEIMQYFTGILQLRIMDVQGGNKFRKYESQMYMPAWIQFSISQIGQVIDTTYGLTFNPTMDFEELDIDTMLKTSSKLKYFRDAGVELLNRAFPRSIQGDANFMTLAVIKGKVASYKEGQSPLSMYLAAFLDSTIEEHMTLRGLYRIEYQDVEYVKRVLETTGGLVK